MIQQNRLTMAEAEVAVDAALAEAPGSASAR